MIRVNKENFEEEVLKYKGKVVVEFWSETCQPCKELLPDVEELSKKYDVKVVGDAASPRRILDATAEAYRVINGL